jgi:hypothetical protein
MCETLFLVVESTDMDLPPIGFCILLLLGSKYAWVPVHWALIDSPKRSLGSFFAVHLPTLYRKSVCGT